MMTEQEFIDRLKALEALVYQNGNVQPKDLSGDIKQLRDDLMQAKTDAAVALARRIPVTAHLASKQHVQDTVVAAAKAASGAIKQAQQDVRAEVDERVARSLGQVHSELVSTKNLAMASATVSAQLLRQRAAFFAKGE